APNWECDRPGCARSAGAGISIRMHAPQSLYKGFVGHALDDVPKRAGSHRLMNIFIPFVGSENQALCVRILLPDSAQGIKPAHSRQSQVHQGDVGMMLLE